MSGEAAESDEGRTIQAGFDHYLLKPVALKSLQRMMQR
jgi:CheY-like chemotaxis protein